MKATKLILHLILLSVFILTGDTLAQTHALNSEYIKEWLVLGPLLPDASKKDFLADMGGEASIEPKEGDTVTTADGKTLTWKRYKSKENFIDLLDADGQHENAIAYAFCILQSEQARSVKIRLGHDDDVMVWMNGHQMRRSVVFHFYRVSPTENVLVVYLKAGANHCLVKVSNEIGDWGLAMRVLASIGDSATKEVEIPALINALRDKNADIRARAAYALARIGKPAKAVAPALITALADEDDYVRYHAEWALARLPRVGEPAAPALITALADEDDYVRYHAALALSWIGKPPKAVVPVLITALADEDDYVRYHAAWVLARSGDFSTKEAAVPVLTNALADESYRNHAVWALSLIGELAEAAVPALINALADEDAEVRLNVVRTLGVIGKPAKAAVPALVNALADEDGSVRSYVAEALGVIGEPAKVIVPALMNALTGEDRYIRGSAALALGRIGEPAKVAVPALISVLVDESGLSHSAEQALKRIGIPEAMKHIYERKNRADAMLFASVLIAIGLLHLLLFVFYPKLTSNLYYAILVGNVAIAGSLIILGTEAFNLTLQKVTAIICISVSISGLRFLYSLFYTQLPKQFWVFLASWCAIGGVAFYTPDPNTSDLTWTTLAIFIFAFFLFFLVSLVEVLRVLLVAIKKKKDGAWVIGIGFMVFAFAVIAVTVEDSWKFNFGILDFGTLESGASQNSWDFNFMVVKPAVVFVFATLGLLISMSIYLARNFAKTNNALQTAKKNLEAKNTQLQVKSEALERSYDTLKRTQAQLIQSEKMATVGTLAGGVAHEINNPMDAILGSVQRILRVSKDPEKVVESAQSAQEGTRRCKDIVGKLLKYARQSSDEFTALDINQVINDTVALLTHQLKLENISLQMQLSPRLNVQGNFNELSQVITNLLINAKDAVVEARVGGKQAGVITVRTTAEKEEVLIEVSDDGVGIAAEDVGKLFDPFFTTKPVGKGTGLGLSICQGIVEKHRGRIQVASKVEDGATFRVFLPISES